VNVSTSEEKSPLLAKPARNGAPGTSNEVLTTKAARSRIASSNMAGAGVYV
jgi:hypothetical protein